LPHCLCSRSATGPCPAPNYSTTIPQNISSQIMLLTQSIPTSTSTMASTKVISL
jgi:hypothetical protein